MNNKEIKLKIKNIKKRLKGNKKCGAPKEIINYFKT